MVEVNNLTKRFRTFALNDITFHLPKGYIMGIVGANGSGKSSLLKLLLGVYGQTAGEIRIDGISLGEDTVEAKQKMGFVMAENLFTGEFSLEENGKFYGKYYTFYQHEKLLYLCEQFDLKKNKKLKRYSKGEQLKFQFAFALAHNPQVLILDEPTANFDPEFREEFRKQITSFVADGQKSVILATHNMEDLDQIADYIGFMHRGRMVFYLNREEIESRYCIAMGENYKIDQLPKEEVIYREDGMFGTKAFLWRRSWATYDKELVLTIPGMEDIVYYLLKANEKGVGEFEW